MDETGKTYLGDAVSAHYDGYRIWLTTSNGIRELERIALEPEVYERLVQYALSIKGFVQ